MGCRGPKPKTLNVSCPNENCPDYGKISKGNIVANGTYKARGVRMHKYICRTCSKSFSSSSNTIFHDLRTDEKTILLALKMIVKGMSLRGTAEILEVKLDTVRGWLQKAAEHSEEVDKVLIKELNVDKVELDELWTFVQKKTVPKMEHESEDERWIWLSFVSEHRLILGAYAGPMTQDSADRIIQITGEKINEKKLPIFITDGRKYYAEALLKKYTVFPKTGKRGRPRKPRQMPLEELKYAQVIKTREGGKVINIQRKIIFGEKEDIDESIISTAYIERQNLTLRQDNNRLTRKTIGYSKKDEWLQHQTTLQITNHNFIRTHESLKIVDKKQIKGKTWKKYRKQTPTMSIGITDHIWTLKELLTYPYHQELQPIKGS